MDTNGCKLHVSDRELTRGVNIHTLQLWEKLKQKKHIRDAETEDLEECPFCVFAIIISYPLLEVPDFQCWLSGLELSEVSKEGDLSNNGVKIRVIELSLRHTTAKSRTYC